MNLIGIRKFLNHRFTFLLVPHGQGPARQFSFRMAHIVLAVTTWTAVTAWGSYLSARQVDYWRSEASNRMLKMKVEYLVAQINQSKDFLDEVKTVDGQLRQFLNYQTPVSLIKNELDVPHSASGGPTLQDQDDVTRLLDSTDPNNRDLSWGYLKDKVDSIRMEAQSRLVSFDDINNWIEIQRKVFRATPQGWPCPGELSSHFGKRLDPFSGMEQGHFGVDIAGPTGTPIRATADGVVRLADYRPGYGRLVVIQHAFGYSTRYAHNSRIAVKNGDWVRRGDVIAYMGKTGRASGSHCHYEVWRYDQRKNPIAFLKEDFMFAKNVPAPRGRS